MLKFSMMVGLLFVVSQIFAQPLLESNQKWVKVESLSDEFNEDQLDDDKWIPRHTFWAGREPSQFKEDNVSVKDGFLKLKSTVANYEKNGNWVHSACVSSKTTAMKRGYYSEARIKCPELSMTGAYWFQGAYSEIDVIENFGAPTGEKYQGHETHYKSNLHYFKDGWKNDKSTPWEAPIVLPPCHEAFHVYGVWWKDENTVIFYLNGKEVHTSKTGGAFLEDMYMYFDMETFNWGVGLPTIESLDDPNKNTQYVDYVRTYKLVQN